MPRPALASIPLSLPFLPAIAEAWLADPDPDTLILLPTRRAARSLAEAFLAASHGRPLLLPRIAAIGGLDEAPLRLAGALDRPPVAPERRLAVLARLVLARDPRCGIDLAWPLAAELTRLLDDAARAEVDLADALPRLVPEALAQHWQLTLRFLSIVTRAWPDWLEDNGLTDIGRHAVAVLRATAAGWAAAPPSHPVWAVGVTGAFPAVAELLRTVAHLPQGRVVLPGLDPSMSDAGWEALADTHPQAGLRALLAALDARRGDVAPFPTQAAPISPPARAALLARALLPAAELHRWQGEAEPMPDGVQRLSPRDPQEEAVAIAAALREALETPNTRAALVTPDRDLARRVAAELGRYGIVADDSAGEPLARTPPAVFLRLLAEAVLANAAPLPTLALLKHPLAAAGLVPATCRARARQLETHWREARPGRPLPPEAASLLATLESILAPLRALPAEMPPAAALRAMLEAAEVLARTDTETGADRLWAQEEGEALADHLAALLPALEDLPPQPFDTLPGLLEASLAGMAVRSRRALRGGAAGLHPRIATWGLLEARLQTADLLILGGLAEGVWPRAADTGPWLSRPMRRALGLPSPEAAVGQDAQDFAAALCAAPRVILSVRERDDKDASIPSRFVVRLQALLRAALPEHPACGWARALDRAERTRPAPPPRPQPSVALRPRELTVTDVETWLADPYAIHAKYVLGLKRLPRLDEDAEAADYGTVVHAAMQAFIAEWPRHLPQDAAARLCACMDRALTAQVLRPAVIAWWRPRLHRIAEHVIELETARRREHNPTAILVEKECRWTLDAPAGPFTLRGRPDRVDHLADGGVAILDYKTGTVPDRKRTEQGMHPQLPLLALLLEAHGLPGPVTRLAYWGLTGGRTPGKEHLLFEGGAAATRNLIADTAERLRTRIATFDDERTPYLSRPGGRRDYARLARQAEWQRGADAAEIAE